MEIKYQYFESHRLLFQKFIGEFDFNTYMAYSQQVTRKLAESKLKVVIIDFRRLTFGNIPDDLLEGVERMSAARKQIQDKEVKRKDIGHVFWVDDPLPTVVARLFMQSMQNMEYQYCSTPESVMINLERMGSPVDDIDALEQEIKNTFTMP